MKIDDLLKFRQELLENSTDQDGYISPNSVLEYILPSLVETKLIESAEINTVPQNPVYSIAGYLENESGERLQLFLVDSSSVSMSASNNNVLHTKKDYHNSIFKAGVDFVKKSVNRHLDKELQDSDPLAVLYHKLGSSAYVDQIDVIELILLSSSVSVESRSKEQTPKRFVFDDDKLRVSFSRKSESLSKELLIQFKLIDIGYLYQVSISTGNADPLTVMFGDTFGSDIEVLKAAEEENFESYLCVLPAIGLAQLYKKESSRLLEKNVRSFLNFKVEANKEMRNTIRKEPERFIAYNNGLTITGSTGEVIKVGDKYFLKSIKDFQIVNGGQTTAGIYFSFKDGLDVSKINLMAKINIAKNVTEEEQNELISKISRFSNTQTKVSKVDLKTSNNELKMIKTLSSSVLAPNNNKWYFDLSKGEFETLVKLSGNKKKIEKEFPKQRRFTKEQLGKYYTSWGLYPYLVKLGGDKVFRYFIEEISGDGDKKKPKTINRDFYEHLIARIILFSELENLHGSGKSSIGQLRSAVVPYSMSALYLNMNADKNKSDFDLGIIWRNQALDDFMRSYFLDLMKLMNNLIKDYSQSDDYGSYSKKEQLWKDISSSKELKEFFKLEDSVKFVEKYGIQKSKSKSDSKIDEVDFSILIKTVEIASNGVSYYKELLKKIAPRISEREESKILSYLAQIVKRRDIEEKGVLAIESLIQQISINQPSMFEEISPIKDEKLVNSLNGIIEQYNVAINKNISIESEFHKSYLIATSKSMSYSSVFNTIGKKLSSGQLISLAEVYSAADFYQFFRPNNNLKEL
jgi:hypothetical protein